jgi:hypothetical protein
MLGKKAALAIRILCRSDLNTPMSNEVMEFLSSKPERKVRQVGETQKAARELNRSIKRRANSFRCWARHSCRVRDAVRR